VWLVCGLLVLAVAIVFLQTAAFQFVNLDDDQYVYNSPVTQLGLSRAGIARAFTHSQIGNWHPLTTISFMLDWSLFGANAGGYHVHNVFLHAAAVVLLFLALRRMTGALWPGALAAALFAIHPLRAESVAWVSERKDVLSGVYLGLTLLAYGYYVTRPSLPRYLLVFLFMAMGLMSKAMLVTLPVILLLLDYWPLERFRFIPARAPHDHAGKWKQWLAGDGRLVIEKVPLLLLSAGFALITAHLSLSASRAVAIVPLHVRLAMAPISCVTYLGQMFYPFDLAAHYPFAEDGPPAAGVVGACLLLATVSGAVIVYRRRYPYLLAGWLWYLVTLLPVIGLVPGGNQLMADRYTYMTQIGLSVALVWLAADISASWPSRGWFGIGGSVALIVGLMAIAWRQTSYWHDSITLWRHALSCTWGNDIADEHLADALVEESHAAEAKNEYQEASGELEEARQHFEEALWIMPDNVEALINLGTLLTGHGDPADAIPLYERALKVNPDLAATYYDLGNALHATGDGAGAMENYRKAIQIDPAYAGAHNNLGNLLAENGRKDEAVAQFRLAVECDPHFVQAYINLGNTLLGQGRIAEAVENFEKALHIDADNADALANLATALSREGRLDEAIVKYQRALQIDSRPPVTWYNLGYCYEKTGRISDAAACYQRALSMLAPQGDSALADIIRGRLKDCGETLKPMKSR
jgi:tetratricopeptide (TPR) repeat protein